MTNIVSRAIKLGNTMHNYREDYSERILQFVLQSILLKVSRNNILLSTRAICSNNCEILNLKVCKIKFIKYEN